MKGKTVHQITCFLLNRYDNISLEKQNFYSLVLQNELVADVLYVQFDAEFRRFGLSRSNLPSFDEFINLLEEIHKLNGSSFTVAYTDPEGDLLPISNNENFAKALTTARPLLRVFINRKGKQ